MDRSECPRGSRCVGRDCPDCANFSPPPAEQASGELLPLPSPGESISKWAYDERDMKAYARANVDRALAESRAECERQAAYAKRTHDWNTELHAQVKRLAEALREMLELRQATQAGRVTERHELEIVADARAALNLEPRND